MNLTQEQLDLRCGAAEAELTLNDSLCTCSSTRTSQDRKARRISMTPIQREFTSAVLTPAPGQSKKLFLYCLRLLTYSFFCSSNVMHFFSIIHQGKQASNHSDPMKADLHLRSTDIYRGSPQCRKYPHPTSFTASVSLQYRNTQSYYLYI